MTKVSEPITKQLIPTGKLRVAIAVATTPSMQFAIQDGTGYRGVAITLGDALARKLGVVAELTSYSSPTEVQNASSAGAWNVAFLPVDEEQKKFFDFGAAFHVLQFTYLVASEAALFSVVDVNLPCVRIGAIANSAGFRASTFYAPKATHFAYENAADALQALREGAIDVFGASRESLAGLQLEAPGSWIFEDNFKTSTTSIALPKGKPDALEYVRQFIEEAKASGLVRKAFDDIGLATSQTAPLPNGVI